MNEYINTLYEWIAGTDVEFGAALTSEQFEEKLQNEDYATRMYTWISETDPNFQQKLSLDFFLNKVKKKDISSSTPSITTNIESAGLSEEIQETEEVQPSGDSVEQNINLEVPNEGEAVEEDATYSIEGTEVEPEAFEEYASLQKTQKEEDADPFEVSINQLDLDFNEGFLAPQLNYEFAPYGFKFSEAAPGLDKIKVEAANGNSYTFNVDTPDPQNTKLFKDFLVKNKSENKKLNAIEERIAVKKTKFLNEKQIENSLKMLDVEAQSLNKRIQNYSTSNVKLYRLNEFIKQLSAAEVNSSAGIALRRRRDALENKVKDEKIYILKQDAELAQRGVEVDRLAGKYLSMKAEQGDFGGITQKALLKGQGKITSFASDIMTDILVSDFSPIDAISGGTLKYGMPRGDYESLFANEAAKRGYVEDDDGNILRTEVQMRLAADKGKYTPPASFAEFQERIGDSQVDDVDSFIKDMGRKKVKYGNVEFILSDATGEQQAQFKKVGGSARYSDESLKRQLGDMYEDGMAELTREGLNLVLGDSGTTEEYYDATKETFWGGAWIGLGESVPAMIGGPGKVGWAVRTAKMFSQVENSLKEEMMRDPDFATISENERRAVATPIALTVGVLESYGLRNVLNSGGLVNNVLLKSLQKFGPKAAARTRGLTFQQVVRNEVDNMLLKGTLVIGAAGAAEFETGVAQEIADIGGKMIYNELKKQDMFQTPESVADGLRQVAYAGAQEMVGGWVMGSLPATATAFSGKDYEALSDGIFKTFESISQDPTIFKFNIQKIKDQINSGQKTKEQGQAEIDILNDIRGTIPKVPTDLSIADRKKAVGLLLSKQDLLRQRDNTAPELRGKVDKEIGKVDKLLSDIIEGTTTLDPSKVIVEEDEVTDEEAVQFLKDQNESSKFFGIAPIEINTDNIAIAKEKLKTQRDASKKQSPVPKAGKVESQTTEEVAEGVPNELQESAREGEQETEGEVAPQKKTEVNQEVQDIQEFEGETDGVIPESDVVVEEETEVKTENITKDGKVKTTKSETKVETKAFEPVIRFSKRAARAISKILPKVNIVLHESSSNFNKSTGTTGRGFYNPTDQTIHIDLTKGNNKTVAHEVFHALLLNSVKTNAQARAITKRMVAAVAKAKGLTTQQKKKINDFISNYDEDIQNEEKLAEILGVLAEGYTKLDAPSKSKIRRWVETIAKKLGIDIENFTKTDQDVIDLLNTVAGKLAQGKVITKKDVKAITPKKKPKKKQESKQEGDQFDLFEGREQKDIPQRSRKLAESYMMNVRGFISARALYDSSRLKRELEEMGMRLGTARNEFTGEITGYYFQRVSRNGKPYFYNPFRRQQKDIDKAAGNLNDIASTVVRLRDNNFSPEAIRDYLINKKKFDSKLVDGIMSVSNFVLTRVPESFGKVQGGVIQGLKFFSKLNKFRENLINNNLTPFGKRMSKLNQELEVLKSKKGKNEAAIKSIENKMEKLKERNPGAKLFKFTQTEITDKVINYMKSQKEYIDASKTKNLSTLQAQMEMQIAKSFYATPSVNMSQQIRIARGVVGKVARETNDINRLKSSLRNYIRAVLPPVEYDKPEILSLIKEIQGATKENIKDVKQKVLNLAVGKVVSTLDSKITKLLKTNFAKVEGGRRKANVVDAQAIKILESIRNEFADIKSKTPDQIVKLIDSLEAKVKKLQEQTEQDESNFSEQNKLDIILNYASAMLKEDSDISKVSELNGVLTNLNLIVTEGRGALEQQKRDMYHRYLKDFEIAWKSITGNKVDMLIKNPDYDPQLPISKSNEQLIVNPKAKDLIRQYSKLTDAKKNASKNIVSRTLGKIKNKILNFTVQKRMDLPSIIEYMTKLPGEMFEGEFADITSDAFNESSNRYKLFTMQDKAALENILKESYGKDWIKGVKRDSLTIDTGIAYNLEEYNKAKKNYESNPSKENKAILDSTTIRLQPLQMAYLVYQYKDPANKESFETKYGEQYERIMFQMEEMLETNHQPVIGLAEWMVNEAYPALYNRYNEVYKAIYRVDMPWNQFYIGPIRREGQDETEVNLSLDGQSTYAGMSSPDYSKIRIQNKRPMADQNLLESYVAYGDKMNWFAGYGENFNRVSKLFNNPDLEKIIRTEYPEGSYDVIKGIIDKIAVKGISKMDGLDKLFNTATSLFVVGRLGVNPTIFLKQLVSFPTYVNEIGVVNWTKHAALGIGQIKSTFDEIMANSVYIQDRYSRDFIRSIENYKNDRGSEYDPNRSKFKLFTNKFQQLLNVQMYLVKQGDKGAIMIGGIPVYNYHKAEFMKKNPGATEQQAIDYAIKRFEKATRTTQQSTDLTNRDYYQDGGVIARTFNMFKTSIIQYLRKEILYTTNMYRIMRGEQGRGGYGKIRNFYESSKGLLVYHTVLPMLFQYLSAGLPGLLAPWDEEDGEDLTRAAIIGNLNAMFLLGDMIAGLADSIQDKPWGGEITSLPLIEQYNDFTAKVQNYYKVAGRAKEQYDLGNYQKGDEIKSKADQVLFELFVEDIPQMSGINSKSLAKWYKNIETLITTNEDPRKKLLRLFNYSDYQILSEEERKPEARKRGGLTQRELKKYYPELYNKQQELKEQQQLPPKLQRQLDKLKEEQKRMREEMLEKVK